MSNEMIGTEFIEKFTQLSAQNQTYIIAIQQALMFAQANEKLSNEKSCKNESCVGVLSTE